MLLSFGLVFTAGLFPPTGRPPWPNQVLLPTLRARAWPVPGLMPKFNGSCLLSSVA